MINFRINAWHEGYKAFRGMRFFFFSLVLSFCSFFVTLALIFSGAGPFF